MENNQPNELVSRNTMVGVLFIPLGHTEESFFQRKLFKGISGIQYAIWEDESWIMQRLSTQIPLIPIVFA